MASNEGNLLRALTGGTQLKRRVQHPQVEECRDYKKWYWFFRYYDDEIQPDGSVKTSRKRHICGDSKGPDKISFKRAEQIRDDFLHDLNAAPTRTEAAVQAQEEKPPEPGDIIFGKLAELWQGDYADNPMIKLATPTREKYKSRLENHILPRWNDARLKDLDDSKAVIDWLQQTCTSWWMMIDLRNTISGIITRAQEWGLSRALTRTRCSGSIRAGNG